MHQLTIFGSGTGLPDAERGNSGYCWQGDDGLLLLDCGGTPYQQMLRCGLDPKDLRAIFLSHSHPDHIGGLPLLLFHLWLGQYRGDLTIACNSETLRIARGFCEALGASEHMIAPRWVELPDSGGALELPHDFGVDLQTAPTVHSRPTLALRLRERSSGRALVYGADSDTSQDLLRLSQDAHTLIHECTVSKPFQSHATPEQVGEIARDANVGRVVIVHYSPRYTAPEQEVIERIRAVGFEGEIHIGRDGDRLALGDLTN